MNQIKKLNEMIQKLESEGYETRFYVEIPKGMGIGDGWQVMIQTRWINTDPLSYFQEMMLYRRKKPAMKPVEDVVRLDIQWGGMLPVVEVNIKDGWSIEATVDQGLGHWVDGAEYRLCGFENACGEHMENACKKRAIDEACVKAKKALFRRVVQ